MNKNGFTPHRAKRCSALALSVTIMNKIKLLEKIRNKRAKRRIRAESGALDLVTGFTIMELLVAMSVFAIVIAVAVGIFDNSLRGERRLVSLMSVQNNMNAALEEMAREMRGGYLFTETSPVGSCTSTISFLSPTGQGTTTYALLSGAINRTGYYPSLGSSLTTRETGTDVKVDNLCFMVNQYGMSTSYDACSPWRITILASVEPAVQNPSSLIQPFNIQTTVSSRVLPKDMPPSLNVNNCK